MITSVPEPCCGASHGSKGTAFGEGRYGDDSIGPSTLASRKMSLPMSRSAPDMCGVVRVDHADGFQLNAPNRLSIAVRACRSLGGSVTFPVYPFLSLWVEILFLGIRAHQNRVELGRFDLPAHTTGL